MIESDDRYGSKIQQKWSRRWTCRPPEGVGRSDELADQISPLCGQSVDRKMRVSRSVDRDQQLKIFVEVKSNVRKGIPSIQNKWISEEVLTGASRSTGKSDAVDRKEKKWMTRHPGSTSLEEEVDQSEEASWRFNTVVSRSPSTGGAVDRTYPEECSASALVGHSTEVKQTIGWTSEFQEAGGLD